MASFTDKAPTFNPYVGTQPIEDMVKVGMIKQGQYDQGVQKIQESYNKIAGLDIMKEGDRSYLQSKLTETTDRLRKFAAGDFSNSQLTNSVTGMITGLSKDENIRNSVFATAKVRREMNNATEAEKSGKSSVVNQWALQQEISNWMNDGQVGSSFTGKYTPFTDVDKKLREVYDKMDDAEKKTQNPFIRDTKGNTIYYSPDGKKASITPQEGWEPRTDQAMLTTLIKGKSASKILDTFKASLTEDDINQLHLNSKYHYRNMDGETLKGEFSKRIENKRAEYKKTISDINIELDTNKDLTQLQEEKLRANLKKYKSVLEDGELDKELQDGLKKLEDPNNQDSFKYKIYTENYLNDLSTALETESISYMYDNNPYFKAQMDLKNLQFKYDDARRQQANADRLYGFEVMKWTEKVKADKAKAAEEAAGDNIFVTDGSISTKDAEGKFTTVGLATEISQLIGTPEEIKSKGYGSAGALGLLNSEFYHLMDESLTQEEKVNHLNKMAEQYMHNPDSIKNIDNPDWADYLKRRYALDKTIARKQNLYKTATTHADSQKFDVAIEASLQGMPEITTPEGTRYTAKETLSFLQEIRKFYNREETYVDGSDIGIGRTVSINVLDTDKLLKAFSGTRYDNAAKIYAKYHGGGTLSASERQFINQFQSLGKEASESAGKIREAQESWREEYIRKHSPESQTQVGVIPSTNKKYIAAAKAFVQRAINEVNSGTGAMDNYKGGDFNVTSAQEALTDPNAGYVITKNFDGTAILEIQSKGTVNRMPLQASDLNEYLPAVSKSNPMNEAKQLIESSPIHSTNIKASSGPDAAISAYFNGYQLPEIAKTNIAHRVRMDIIGKPANDGGPGDEYYIKLYYLDDSNRWITNNTRRYKSLAATQADMYVIDESTIMDMVEQSKT